MNLCEIRTIRSILERHGFHFTKALGQNFLTEDWVPRQIAEMCGAEETNCVLEIGPGIGCLTRELAERAHQVVSVEIDKKLLPILNETLADIQNVEIISGDILKTDIRELCQEKFSGRKIYACANLPYYITTEAISALLESHAFEAITIMVQKEVAQRIQAMPGTSAYSAFSLYVNYYMESRILFEVPADCFLPRPKVDSAVIRLDQRPQPAASVENEKLFFSLIRAAFNQRRKTLVNALKPLLGSFLSKEQIGDLISSCGFEAKIRGECLSIQDFAKLSNAVEHVKKA